MILGVNNGSWEGLGQVWGILPVQKARAPLPTNWLQLSHASVGDHSSICTPIWLQWSSDMRYPAF